MRFAKEQVVETLKNLERFKIRERISLVDKTQYIACGYKKDNNTPPAADADWKPLAEHNHFIGKDEHFWLHVSFETPQDSSNGEECIKLRATTGREGQWDACNPQGLIYLDGVAVQGLDTNHTELMLEFGKTYDMYIYFYNGMYPSGFALGLNLCREMNVIHHLIYDIAIPRDAAEMFDRQSSEWLNTYKYLVAACNMLDFRNGLSDELIASAHRAVDFLQKEFYEGYCGQNKMPEVTCIGHTHIDVAWQWTVAQTEEKAQRSFATVLNLMKQYPEYKFFTSQPQLLEHVKRNAPELYERIKEAHREGRFEIDGAMWLEADCNLTSGESLVRQVIHGRRFMREEFGVDSKTLWLPDVFGYSAALPQILKKSNVDRFVTSKISWNETNRMPYDVFMWQGIDGTEIFSYFLTAQNYDRSRNTTYTTYVGTITPQMVKGTYERFQQKEYTDKACITYGFGDGGGGPTMDMLEKQRRLAYGLPGIPVTKMQTAKEFLDGVEADFHRNAELLGITPKWVGELYLEMHRGTYTTQAKNKKFNRRAEHLLQATETVSLTAQQLLGMPYEESALYDAWQKVLLLQFHDIIPGSSIREVYEDSDKTYGEVFDTTTSIRDARIAAIAKAVDTKGGLWVYNPAPFAFSGLVEADGKNHLVKDIPAMGWAIVEPEAAEDVYADTTRIENGKLRVVLNERGEVVSVYDKVNSREVVAADGVANKWTVFEDYPRAYDAWEITSYYKQKSWDVDDVQSIEVIREDGRAGVRVTRKYNKSTFVQDILLESDGDGVVFRNKADWHEDHVLLKAYFPLNVHADRATYEVQFGTLDRSTHENTSWDAAKFEVCAHKWADMSDGSYGVSLLNDCKYGYSAEDNVLSLTLLKAPTSPDPEADRGEHEFTYVLYPHKGDWREGGTVAHAYALNRPAVACVLGAQKGDLPAVYSAMSCSADALVVDTLKAAYDGSGDAVARLYESANTQGVAILAPGFAFSEAVLCDTEENEVAPLEVKDGKVVVPYGHYELLTIRFKK